jgi:hypothetical protein
LIRHYAGTPQANYKKEIAQLEQMIKGGNKTTAHFDQEMELFKKGDKVLSYTVSYKYTVNGKQYDQKKTYQNKSDVPQVDQQDIYYLATNPEVSSFDPGKDATAAKAGLKNEKETPTTAWTILAISIPLFALMIYLIRKENRQAREEALWQQQAATMYTVNS